MIGAALAIGLSALGTAWAQARIGTAGTGVLAEKPELLNSIFLKDYNAIMALTLFSAVLTLIGILLSDISYAIVDPRISFD